MSTLWTDQEVATLIKLADTHTTRQIADEIGRQYKGVEKKAKALGIQIKLCEDARNYKKLMIKQRGLVQTYLESATARLEKLAWGMATDGVLRYRMLQGVCDDG